MCDLLAKFFFRDLWICNLRVCDLRTQAIFGRLKISASLQENTFYLRKNIAFNVIILLRTKYKNHFKKMTFRIALIQSCIIFCSVFADLRFAD